jgi:AcrR family transcriptional regulator
MEKDNIQKHLLNIGRQLIQEKGTDALTVRKLSEASGCSVGAIYNQFSNMDKFIMYQNYMTLKTLSKNLAQVKRTSDPYFDINNMLQVFVEYVLKNKNLWYLLYRFHLHSEQQNFSFFYLRQIVKILRQINAPIAEIVPQMERPERMLSTQVLWLTMFALSALLTKNMIDSLAKVNKNSICQILLNTYIAGLTVLEQKE